MSNSNVTVEEVAKYYLISELNKILPGESTQKELEENISKMSTKEMWRLLEALSFTYRLNGIFWRLSDDGLIWSKENIDCNNVVLTGMNPSIDKVTHTDVVSRNPLKFKDYLLEYFKKHPENDPEDLGQFRPRKFEITYPSIIVLEEEGKFLMLDGSNRLMAQVMGGENSVSAYVGKRSKPGKMRIGDSTFWLLRRVYEKGDEETKQAVLTVIKRLIEASSDGKSAVETYWIEHARDETIKQVGEKLIEES